MKRYFKQKIIGWIMGIIMLAVLIIILYAKYGS